MSNKMDIVAIQKSLESGLNTNVNEFYLPSLGRNVGFKPLLTAQCKTLAKMLIEANEKPLDTFKTTLGMIKETCLDDSVDINQLTELDRIKILVEFYRVNNILKDFDVDCPHCQKKTKIKIDIDDIINGIDKVDIKPVTFNNGQTNELTCEIVIPKLPVMYGFYEAVQKEEVEFEDMVKCFISTLKLTFENTDVETIDVKIDDYTTMEYFKIIDMIPYNLTANTNNDSSLFDIVLEIVENMMTSGDVTQTCVHCGKNLEDMATARNFT